MFSATGEKGIIRENEKRGWHMGENISGTSLPNDASILFFLDQIVYMTVEGALKEARAEIEGPEKNTTLFIPNDILYFLVSPE